MQALFKKLRDHGVKVSLKDEDLVVKFNGEHLPEDLLAELRERKGDIVEHLRQIGNDEDALILPAETRVDNCYPLTSAQHRMWLMSQFDLANVAYNMRGGFEFTGALDKETLFRAFRLLIDRYEILRTSFRQDPEGDVFQIVHLSEDTGINLTYKDVRKRKYKEKILDKMFQEDLSTPFDLEKAPLIRATLYQLENDRYVFTYVIHHIISDGWSMEILKNELMTYYNALRANQTVSLGLLPFQYKDYAVWENQRLEKTKKLHRDFWLGELSGELPILQLPEDKKRPTFKTYNGDIIIHEFEQERFRSFKEMLKKQGCSLYMGLLATMTILLYRYTGQEDIIVGTTSAGRNHRDLESQIGLFLNTLALRVKFESTDTFSELLDKVKGITLRAYEHEDYPFEELISELNVTRDLSRNPLFDVILILQNLDTAKKTERFELAGTKINEFNGGGHVISKTDLAFDAKEIGDTLRLAVEYNTDIFNLTTILGMVNHFDNLIREIVAHPDLSLGRYQLLTEAEISELTNTVTNVRSDEGEGSIIEQFEKKAGIHPNKVALIHEEENLTFARLNEEANRLANFMIARFNPRSGQLIAIHLPRGKWSVIALLAILKTGAAYLPVDMQLPKERINYILEDSRCLAVFNEKELFEFLEGYCQWSPENNFPDSQPEDLAYIMYTSGSSGFPKGVMIEHGNINAFFGNLRTTFRLDDETVFGATTNFTFDISLLEILGTLVNGMTVHLFEELNSLQFLIDPLNKVSALQMTPSKFNQLIEDDDQALNALNRLKVLLIGGEAWSEQDYEKLKSLSEVSVFNVYGPTETTIWTTCLPITDSACLSIGYPLPGEQVYILDKNFNLVPPGVTGEICIGGRGVGRGYQNNIELSQEKFVQDPFKSNGKLYKTGDLGKRMIDGNLIFQGRVDNQLKVRGYRIELEEIKQGILRHQDIDMTTVIPRIKENGQKYIAAYFVSKQIIDTGELRRFLSAFLPVYMLPELILQVDSFELTTSGKLNTAKLLETHGGDDTEPQIVLPVSRTEQELLKLWARVLGFPEISTDDNFFSLGGHSLKITRLSGHIYKTFGVKLSLKDLFINPVLKDQALIIDEFAKTSYNEIPEAPLRTNYPISTVQRRLWIQSQVEDVGAAYNLSNVHLLQGVLDPDAMNFAFEKLIDRHESLRTSFKEQEKGYVTQIVHDSKELSFKVAYCDCRTLEQAEKDEVINKDFLTPFDLTRAPLIRVGVYQILDDQWAVTLTIHHIVSDAWSLRVIVDELFMNYNAFIDKNDVSQESLRIQYKDYALWQHNRLNAEELDKDREYWLKQFETEVPVLQLPGHTNKPEAGYVSRSLTTMIDSQDLKKIQDLADAKGCTLYMALLSVVNVLFYRYTGVNDITIGTPVAGRDHIDLERQIGFYVNTLALRTRVNGKSDNFENVLDHVKELTINAYQHQHYPFDELVAELNLERGKGRNPLFDTLVVLQNQDLENSYQKDLIGLTIKPYDGALSQSSIFDLVFNFSMSENSLRLDLIYNSEIHQDFYANQLKCHFIQLLQAVVQNPKLHLEEIDFLAEQEKYQLIKGFNDRPFTYDNTDDLISAFRNQAAKHPTYIALNDHGSLTTYEQLEEKSDRLASFLVKKYDVSVFDKIGILLERSDNLIVAILAVLKTGAAFVLIDVSLPNTRKRLILEDSGAKLIISQSEYIYDLDFYDGALLAVDIQMATLPAFENNLPKILPDLTAYIIFTSGSTGKPKGVMVDHAAITNALTSHQQVIGVREAENVLQFFSPSFDAFVFEIFIALLNGATLHMYGEQKREDTGLLQAFMNEHEINFASFAPAYLPFVDPKQIPSLKRVLSGGEQPSSNCVASLLNNVDYINAYGPTETCVIATANTLRKGSRLPEGTISIGTPIPGLSIYILNEDQQLAPIGVIGEVFIAGQMLAKGYLNDTELTADKFLVDPFQANMKMYRSGDMARWSPDGTLFFCGRKDDQVKIRGYRIEIGEVQKSITNFPDVLNAVVVVRTNKFDEKELAAYYVSEFQLDETQIKDYLRSILPAYMVPLYLMQLDHIPLTSNGKVDVKSLPDFSKSDHLKSEILIRPMNEVERRLSDIWCEILDKDLIGLQENFFDLGGHSLKAIRLLSRIKEELDVNIKIDDLFNNLTIESMAKEIDAKCLEHQTKQANDRLDVNN